uniref:Myb/SANT-like DNA-binding domain-containing protein 3 n=1 Tax=Diabrotica virgifera virgifera TaxID=50390 RepID=A0A6P7H9Y7_DIAVI
MAKRVTNFSKNEETLLLDLVLKYKDVLDCKKTDTTNNKMKWEVWMKLAKEFNSVSGETTRDVKVLQNNVVQVRGIVYFVVCDCIKMAKRVTNFSKNKETLLLDLVLKYKDLLECKKTDTTNNKMKWEVWMKLAKEFNSVSGETTRDVKVLQNKYENLKRTKQKYASGTRGGPSQNPVFTNTDEALQEIIGPQITGMQSSYD